MIIKVKCADKLHESWKFYDNAKDVKYQIGPETKVGTDGVYNPLISDRFEKEGNKDEIIFISFSDNIHNEHHIYTNTAVYLLNDSGKTIEKIF